MDAVFIRPVRREELEHCAELIRQSFSTVAEEFGLTKENCPSNGAFLETERLAGDWEGNAKMYGLYREGNLCGFMELKEKENGLFTLEKLCVPPPHRHSGYGTRLLDFAKTEAASMGANKISIGIMEEHAVLKNWYERYGFASTGTRQFPHLPFLVGFMELEL
ncbi:MAG TPA: GNAT family N-acetyltransferase [Feifaniaceae bacterium]|nr:GNAT family N-acetyltransferase [Feifaniaceae bacterium]